MIYSSSCSSNPTFRTTSVESTKIDNKNLQQKVFLYVLG